VLADLHIRNAGWYWRELTADFDWSVWLQIERILMRRCSFHEDENRRPFLRSVRLSRVKAEILTKREACTECPNFQELSSRGVSVHGFPLQNTKCDFVLSDLT